MVFVAPHIFSSGRHVENHVFADRYAACVKYVDKYQPDTASTSEREHYQECMRWITPDPAAPVIDGFMTAWLVIMLLSAAITAIYAANNAKKSRALGPDYMVAEFMAEALMGLVFGGFLGAVAILAGLGIYQLCGK